LEELFDPYVTTKTKGTGLGLAIVKKLVEEHGGKVTAENLVNGGACITVCLPVKEAARDAMIEAHPKHPDYRRERA
jgi:nitrogen fixation/metabolism regulation signal transduction histidine kinase